MAVYNAVSVSEKDANSPINEGLIDKLDQNPHAIAEGAPNAPRIQTGALADGCVTKDKLNVQITPGTNRLLRLDFDQTDIGTSATKLYEARIQAPSTLRTVVRADSDSEHDWVRVQIYKNGAAFGTQVYANDHANESNIENLFFEEGDTIEFYAWKENSGVICNGSFDLGYDLASSSLFQLLAPVESTS